MGLPSLSRSLSPGRPSGEARAGALPSGLQLPEPPQERGAAALPAPPLAPWDSAGLGQAPAVTPGGSPQLVREAAQRLCPQLANCWLQLAQVLLR